MCGSTFSIAEILSGSNQKAHAGLYILSKILLVRRTGFGQEYFVRRRSQNFTTLARYLTPLCSIYLRLSNPAHKVLKHLAPADTELKTASKSSPF